MPTLKAFEELEVWKESCRLVKEIYLHSTKAEFDRDLCSQLRRACISIPSNIAEGFEKNSKPEFIRYLRIAKGSAGEARTQVYLARSLNYLTG